MTFHENLLQWCQICKTDHSTHHDVDSGSDAEDKDGVQVCEQVPLRGQDGEEEAGEGETGEIGDENIYCAGRPAEDHSEDQTAQLKIILGGLLCSDQTCSALWLQLGALLPGLFWEQCYCTRVHRSNWKPITPHWIRRFNREMHTFYQISIDRDVMLTNTGWIKYMPLILLLQSFPEQCYIYCSLRSNWQPISAHWISPWASNG